MFGTVWHGCNSYNESYCEGKLLSKSRDLGRLEFEFPVKMEWMGNGLGKGLGWIRRELGWMRMHFAKVGKLGENVLMKVLKFLRRVGISEGRDWILRRKCSDGNSSISEEGWISRTNCKRVDFAKEMFWWTISTFWCSFNFPYQTFQFSEGKFLMRNQQILRRVEFPEQIAKE